MTTTDPRQALRLPAPPPLRPREGGALLLALPALGGLGSVVLVTSSGLGASGAMRARALVAGGLFLLVTVAFVVLQVERQRRQRRDHAGMTREDHLAHLARAREAVAVARRHQRERAQLRHPPSDLLLTSPLSPRRDGLDIRIGSATGPLALELDVPEPIAGQPADPVARRALDRFVAAHASVTGLPVELDLATTSEVAITGPADAARAVARAFVCSAVRGRDAGTLRLAVLADEDEETTREALARWEWLKWLPHHGSPHHTDGVGAARLVLRSTAEVEDLCTPGAHLLLIDERRSPGGAAPRRRRLAGTTLIRIGRPSSAESTVVDLPASRVWRGGADVTPEDFTPDSCDEVTARVFAMRLASVSAANATHDVLEILRRGPREPLRVAIGTSPDGEVVHLDLREPAAGGHGPHGLVIGATGSGKSELLRTLVTGLALAHPPEKVNLLLIDFKGGATFAGLAELPHAAGLITNLADELSLVDRMQDALAGELTRRQHLLREAGLSSARELPHELPTLVVVVDEFTELLAARPDLAELFAGIGRVGRSLGVHLLLASQRLDEGRLRGLESHLGFRIALRTFSAAESRAVIGTPDAHHLPAAPGAGYLATGPEEPRRFQALLVSGPGPAAPVGTRILPFTSAEVHDADARVVEGPPLIDRVVAAARQRAGDGRGARRLWVPPLTEPMHLDDLLATEPQAGPGRLPIGTVDRPRLQVHAPFLLDLRGTSGHLAVVGAPRTGRSSLLGTVVRALAATAPDDVRFAVLDLGGDLAPLGDLPQVTARLERGRAADLKALVRDLVEEASGRRTDRRPADPEVYVVVDGWATLRERWPDLEHDLVTLAQESLSVGIHLVLSASRWGDLRPALRDVVGTKVELRLGDPMESLHGRQRAGAVPARPGHGLTPDGHHFLAAVATTGVSAGRRP